MSKITNEDLAAIQQRICSDQSWRETLNMRYSAFLERRAEKMDANISELGLYLTSDVLQKAREDAAALRRTADDIRTGRAQITQPEEAELTLRSLAFEEAA